MGGHEKQCVYGSLKKAKEVVFNIFSLHLCLSFVLFVIYMKDVFPFWGGEGWEIAENSLRAFRFLFRCACTSFPDSATDGRVLCDSRLLVVPCLFVGFFSLRFVLDTCSLFPVYFYFSLCCPCSRVEVALAGGDKGSGVRGTSV